VYSRLEAAPGAILHVCVLCLVWLLVLRRGVSACQAGWHRRPVPLQQLC